MSDKRKHLIKIIHVARRELGMDRDTYMMMVRNLPGLESLDSTANASVPNLLLILDTLKKRGFKVVPNAKKTKGKPHNFDANAMPLMVTKIEAQLADMGLPWSYADSIASRMFKIQRCAWVRSEKQLSSIIAALDVEQEKQNGVTTVYEYMARLKYNDEQQQAFISQLPENWKRNRAALKQVVGYLANQCINKEV